MARIAEMLSKDTMDKVTDEFGPIPTDLDRALARLALQDIARRHRVATFKAKRQHKRRPLVTLR